MEQEEQAISDLQVLLKSPTPITSTTDIEDAPLSNGFSTLNGWMVGIVHCFVEIARLGYAVYLFNWVYILEIVF